MATDDDNHDLGDDEDEPGDFVDGYLQALADVETLIKAKLPDSEQVREVLAQLDKWRGK